MNTILSGAGEEVPITADTAVASCEDYRSFFVTGGSLPRDAACYVARQADDLLYGALARGEFCYVLTARQMGKSSLMVRAATRLRREGTAAVASLDLTAVGQNLTALQWYRGLLGRLGRQLDIEDELAARWREGEELGPLQRWADTVFDTLLERFLGPIVIFVDEIDAVRSLPFSANEFFGAIREAYNRRALDPRYARLTFCLLGVASPSELITDSRMSPFNIGTRVELTDFTQEEAAPLARGLAGGVPVLSRILYWTGGHPYLTQRLCRAAEEASVRSPAGVDPLCERLFFGRGARMSDDNLLFVQDRLLRSDTDPAALLTLYGRIRAGRRVATAQPTGRIGTLAESLRLSGVVRAEGATSRSRLRVRNRIYARAFDRRWVAEHLPGAELRRQRAAFRRGLSLALAGSGAVVGLLGLFAWRAMRAEGRARQERDNAQLLRFDSTIDFAWHSYQSGDFSRARELLLDLPPEDKTRFEWRYLWLRCDIEQAVFPASDRNGTQDVRFLPDGRTLLIAGTEQVQSYQWIPRAEPRLLATTAPTIKRGMLTTLSPDGKWALLNRNGDTVFVMDAQTGKTHELLRCARFCLPAATFSADGRFLATADSANGTIRLWQTGKWDTPVWTAVPPGTLSPVSKHALAFSPDGRMLAVGDGSGAVLVRDAGTGQLRGRIGQQFGRILALAYAPGGGTLAVSSGEPDAAVRLWDPNTGALRKMLPGEGDVTNLAFSVDGRTLAAGSTSRSVRLWDVKTGAGKITLQLDGTVTALSFSPDGCFLATGALGDEGRVWDITGGGDGHAAARLTPPPPDLFPVPYDVALSSDGHLAAGANAPDTPLQIWDIRSRRPASSDITHHLSLLSRLCFSPDGTLLALTAEAVREGDETVQILDLRTGRPHFVPHGFSDATYTAAFSLDGHTLATGHKGLVRFWDLAANRLVGTLPFDGRVATAIAFSPDGRRVAIGGRYGTLDLFEVISGRHLATLQARIESHREYISALAFSPNGMTLAAGGPDSAVRTWYWDSTTSSYKLQAETSRGHIGAVWALSFSPDGRTFATGGRDGVIQLWDSRSGREMLSLAHDDRRAVAGLSFNQDGSSLVSLDEEGQLRCWKAVPADRTSDFSQW